MRLYEANWWQVNVMLWRDQAPHEIYHPWKNEKEIEVASKKAPEQFLDWNFQLQSFWWFASELSS